MNEYVIISYADDVYVSAGAGGDVQTQVNPSTCLSQENELNCPSSVVARFVFFCGHVALQELIHLDVAIFGELKRRRAVCETDKASNSNTKGKTTSRPSVSVAASATRSAHKVFVINCCELLLLIAVIILHQLPVLRTDCERIICYNSAFLPYLAVKDACSWSVVKLYFANSLPSNYSV